MSMVLRRLLLVLVTTVIALTGMPVHASGLHTAHHQLVPQSAEQHFGHEHQPATEVDCSQVGHCSPVQLFPGAHALALEVSRRGARYAPRDVHAASLMHEASVPPPRRT